MIYRLAGGDVYIASNVNGETRVSRIFEWAEGMLW